MTGYDFTRFAFMALVQCMDAKKHRIFGNPATDYCRQLTSCFAKAHTVADVFDR
jgi:hypothetical protein